MTASYPAIIRIELKYCERCGGLWLRRVGDVAVFCAGCAAEMNCPPDGGEAPLSPGRPRLPRVQGLAAALCIALLNASPWLQPAGGCA